MKETLTVVLIFCSLVFFAQKSEVVFQSKKSNNYAVGHKQYYIEENIDTLRLVHLATLKITASKQAVFLYKVVNLLDIKTSEFNGNSYKLRNYHQVDTSLVLLFDVYFAPEVQLDLIKDAMIKNDIIVFNNTKDTTIREIIVNDSSCYFKQENYLRINTNNRNVVIRIPDKKRVVYDGLIKNGKPASFQIIRKSIVTPLVFVANKSTSVVVTGNIPTSSILVSVGKNRLPPDSEFLFWINYNSGRILMEIYKEGNSVIIN